MRIDRNSLAGDRLRRNFQRLTQGTATADISLTSTAGNLITKTSTGAYQVVIPSSNDLYVDVNGNDSTGTPNTIGLPYQNISTALIAAATLAPATVWLGDGTWNLGSTNFVNGVSSQNPNGVNIIGSGNCRGDKSRGGTIIIGNRPYTSGRMCVPGNDVYYANFYLEGLAGSNSQISTITATAGFGFHVPAGDAQSNNVILDNVGAYCNRAGVALFGSTSSLCNWVVFDSWLQGALDGLNTHGTAANNWSISTINCDIIGTDNGATQGPFVAGVNYTAWGSWYDYGSRVSVLNTNSSLLPQPSYGILSQSAALMYLHGTVITTSTLNPNEPIQIAVSLAASTFLDLACNYNPLSTSVGSGDGSAIIAPYLSTGDIATVNSTGQIIPIHLGTNGYVLTVDSTQSIGMSWQSTSGGGGSTHVYALNSTISTSTSGNSTGIEVNPSTLALYLPLTAGSGFPLSGDLYLGGKRIFDVASLWDTGTSAKLSVDIANRDLQTASAQIVLTWGGTNQELIDTSGVVSQHWTDRLLYDGHGLQSLDYDGRILTQGNSLATTLDWGGCAQYDLSGNLAISWTLRNLVNSTGHTVLNWNITPVTGDLLVANSTSTYVQLPVGTNGQALVANSAVSTGVSWSTLAAPSTFTTYASTSGLSTSTSGTSTQVYFTPEASTLVLAGPLTGANATPTFRQLSTSDIAGYSSPTNGLSTLISTGDLLTLGSTGSTDYTRLAVGTAYQVLTAVPSTASSTDLAWYGTLFDSTGTASMHYQARTLVDASGNPSVYWTTRLLYDTAGEVSEDWGNRLLYDTIQNTSVDWANRLLINSSGNTTFNWNTALSTQILPSTSSDPASPGVGQAWFNTTTSTGKEFFGTDGTNTLTGVINGTLLATAQVQNVTASTTAQKFSNSLLKLPARFMNSLNRTLRITGSFSGNTNGAANTYTLQALVGGSTITLVNTGALLITTAVAMWVDVWLMTRSTGSSGTLVMMGNGVGFNNTTSALLPPNYISGSATVDLTSSTSFEIQLLATTTNASDSINMTGLTITLQN